MHRIKLRNIQLKPIDIFLVVSLGITLLFIIFNIYTDGMLFEKCVLSSSFLFSDYFYHIAGSSDTAIMYSYGDPYSFPPFAYLMYSLLWSMNPYKDSESILHWQNYRNADNALVVFVIYNMILAMLLIYCISQYFGKLSTKYMILLPTALLISYPFMCTSVQRGNVVILVALLLALSWLWMDSENKIKQELSLLFIAIAAGFKLYPALIGIVYLKKKEWKEAIRLIIYGIIVVFIPFLFFGGLDGMKDLIRTLTGFASYIDPSKTNTVCGMAKWLGLKLNMRASYANTFGIIINYLFLAASLLFFFLSKKKWQEALFLSGILVSFLPSNWEYTLVYYVPVLFLFIKENNDCLTQNELSANIWLTVHSIAFGMIFSVNFLMLYYRYGLISGIFTITYLLIGINMLYVLLERVFHHGKTRLYPHL